MTVPQYPLVGMMDSCMAALFTHLSIICEPPGQLAVWGMGTSSSVRAVRHFHGLL